MYVVVLSVVFKSGYRKTLAEAADDVSSVFDSSADFPCPVSDVSIAEDEIVDEVSPCDLRDLTFKNDREPSALQQIQELCRC